MNAAAVVEMRDVAFAYNGEPVVEDVSFQIKEREFASIVGPNGGGKTTLLKLMLGLLQPNRGTVRILGQSPERARPRIGYLPQKARLDPQFPALVRDVVLMGRLRGGWRGLLRRREDQAAVDRALARVDMLEHTTKAYAELSGGQQQRVLIARALACEPELLLLDEPTASLDQHVEQAFYELLKELNRHLAIVLVSHDVGFVSTFVHTVICVRRHVMAHPTSELTGEMIASFYGGDVRMVRHDHRCAEEGHEWLNS